MADLTGIEVGGQIALEDRYSAVGITLLKVDRITPTTVVCGNRSFKLKDGLLIGSGGNGGWNRRFGRIATDADRIRSRVQNAQFRIQRLIVTEKNLAAVESLLAATQQEQQHG